MPVPLFHVVKAASPNARCSEASQALAHAQYTVKTAKRTSSRILQGLWQLQVNGNWEQLPRCLRKCNGRVRISSRKTHRSDSMTTKRFWTEATSTYTAHLDPNARCSEASQALAHAQYSVKKNEQPQFLQGIWQLARLRSTLYAYCRTVLSSAYNI